MQINRKKLFHTLAGVSMLGALATATACHAGTILSEVFYDAAGPDAGRVFVELMGTPGTLLDGLALEGVNGRDGVVYSRVELSGVMPADGIFVVADDSGDGTSRVANADLVTGVDFQNGPDSVVLLGFDEVLGFDGVLDALGYGDFLQGVFAGEGRAAPDAPSGWSLARLHPWLDSNDNRVDFTALETPTPGAVDALPVPLPPGLLLMLSGLAGLLGVGRRLRR